MDINNALITFIRAKFKTVEGRTALLELMLREINYIHMNEEQKFVPLEQALLQLNKEIEQIDINAIEATIKKDFDNV